MRKARTAQLPTPAGANGHVELDTDSAAPRAGRVSRLARSLSRQLLQAMGDPPIAIVLWDGTAITTGTAEATHWMHFRDRGALYRLLLNPDLHFGDLYSAGRIEVEGDFTTFLELAYLGIEQSPQLARWRRLHDRVLNRPRANTLTGSRDNIHHHYDLGNAFYKLWLDREAMQYTCAYYPHSPMTIEQAQVAKMDHVCRKLRLRPGDRVIEAGCGWGGLARHMAKQYGATVRAFNISHEQVAFARDEAKRQGLADRVEYIEDDYRSATGQCDVFVSVGMLEHVGTYNYPELGGVIDRCLTADGRALIHSIGRNRPEKMNAWIERRIFPGAYPPTLREMMDIFEPYNFSVLDIENLRMHYAQTCRDWLARYEENVPAVEKMFDKLFVRAWRLYLAGSVAAFTTGSLQLFQVLFTRGLNNDLPASRAYMYR